MVGEGEPKMMVHLKGEEATLGRKRSIFFSGRRGWGFVLWWLKWKLFRCFRW